MNQQRDCRKAWVHLGTREADTGRGFSGEVRVPAGRTPAPAQPSAPFSPPGPFLLRGATAPHSRVPPSRLGEGGAYGKGRGTVGGALPTPDPEGGEGGEGGRGGGGAAAPVTYPRPPPPGRLLFPCRRVPEAGGGDGGLNATAAPVSPTQRRQVRGLLAPGPRGTQAPELSPDLIWPLVPFWPGSQDPVPRLGVMPAPEGIWGER
ncbi:hypothetical protein P7K49_016058 [Saguinus oedipus]|uniref:Uncharacterized protein n=1 Tax=Saguinus oedipus TaxID=9490 RepID=A0ABQ9VAY9_SAGOE|nr:hypothetical protein P7K49_016058 [Saguinus oedipus]